MRILDRYLSKNIIYPTVSIICILSMIILVTHSLKYIDLMVSHGISVLDFLYVSILLLPSLLFVIIPLSLFIAIMFSLHKLKNQRELSIIKSFGVSNLAISKPVLKVALMVAICHYFIALYVMPEVNGKFKELTKNLKENYVIFFLQENVFVHPTKNLTFFVKKKIGDYKFENIFCQDENEGRPITIVAKSGELVKQDEKVFLKLFNGNRQEISKEGEFNVLNFDELLWQLNQNEKVNNERSISIQERHIGYLLFNGEPEDSSIKKRMFAEANQRLMLPLYSIILTLIALKAIVDGEYSRMGDTKRIITYSGLGAIVLIINTSLINLSASNVYFIFLSYIFTVTVFGRLIFLLFYKE